MQFRLGELPVRPVLNETTSRLEWLKGNKGDRSAEELERENDALERENQALELYTTAMLATLVGTRQEVRKNVEELMEKRKRHGL